MSRHPWPVPALTLAAALGVSSAQAATLNFGVAYARPAAVWAEVGVSDLDLLGGTVSAAVGTRAARLGYARGLAVPPLGAVSARTDLTVTWQGGLRLSTQASGSLGPVALNLGAAAFTTSATAADPLAAFAEEAVDLRDRGVNGALALRYRVSRDLVAVAGGEFGAQPHVLVGLEGRRVLTRPVDAPEGEVATEPLPDVAPAEPSAASAETGAGEPTPTEPDSSEFPEPEPEPEVEPVGTLSWRVGARAGREVLGLSGGVSYATEGSLSLGLDALVGPQTFGVTASATVNEVLGEGSSLRLYAAYEPWRTVSSPLRAGLEARVPAGPGTLGLNVSGGRARGGAAGLGVRVSYALPLASGTQP